MAVTLSLSYVSRLYKCQGKDDEEVWKLLSLVNSISNDYLTFNMFLLFGRIECPALFKPLLLSSNICRYVVRVNFKIKDLMIEENGARCEWHYKDLLVHLLDMEEKCKRIYNKDKSFFGGLISNMNEEEKLEVMRYRKLTPITIAIIKTLNGSQAYSSISQFYYLLKAIEMPYGKGFSYIESKNVDYNCLSRLILRSRYSYINNYLGPLLSFFPEKLFSRKKLCRKGVYSNPLAIEYSAFQIRIFVPAVAYYLQKRNRRLENIQLVLKTIYVERILSLPPNKEMYKQVIHQFILEDPIVVKIILYRQFDKCRIDSMIKYVPSFYIAYDLSLKLLCKYPYSEFYCLLTEKLLKAYPLRTNVEKLKGCIEKLSEDYVKKFAYLLY